MNVTNTTPHPIEDPEAALEQALNPCGLVIACAGR